VFFNSFSSTSENNTNNEFFNLSPEEESNVATVKDYETIIDCIRANSNEEKRNDYKELNFR